MLTEASFYAIHLCTIVTHGQVQSIAHPMNTEALLVTGISVC